ncbi:class I SAM-dependent methyltransferase [Exiguobacterium flavidum]|uniref:class I SAM-dependent methyltransferase n=1 Tax=Exiguobacterium flavidum TaxID=2184695 RepID=UPI000DF80309|nr:class I SAM-dependent methyltransferase [Exiguobacterium flavidum]
MSFSQYGELCTEVYRLTKPVGHAFSGDIAYYRSRLANCEGRILEAMVGSGRVYIPLLEAGLRVEGIDNSPQMLDACAHEAKERGLAPVLYEGALETIDLPHDYEAIIIPAGSFALIEERSASISTLRRLYDHLEPGGRLILDLSLPETPSAISAFSGTSSFTSRDGSLITMETKTAQFDFFTQCHVIFIKYEKWRDGNLIQTELQRLPLRWYGIEEFKMVLKEIGFTDVEVTADYTGKEPDSSSRVFLFEALK